MAKDPTMEHHPIDLQFAKHTAQAAGEAALATGSAMGAGFADPVVNAVVSHLGKIETILKAARNISLTTGGIGLAIREARDLYKEFAGDKK